MDCGVQLRKIPYPYKAMLAICSDLDETPDKDVYWEIMKFLNTSEETAMGPGVGLEVGNSIYFDMPKGQFAYWNTDDSGREMVRSLIKSGHIDCLHSYGDLATTRRYAANALDELDTYGCKLEVWVDHGTAPTNFGSDIMAGHGDEPGHPAYHADLTIGYGIKYIWRGRVTSITGQDVPARLGSIFEKSHPVASGGTLLKETAKRILAKAGDKKYSMHSLNETLRSVALRDNNQVYEFIRSNPHWGGVSSCDQGRHIANVLTNVMLKRLINRGGTCILYTHLGKIDNPEIPFGHDEVESFRTLARMARDENILVATTQRLLKYSRVVREINFDCTNKENGQCINIVSDKRSVFDITESDLDGLTFYVSEPDKTSIKFNGRKLKDIQQNPPDYTGSPSVSIKWPELEFPNI